VLVVRLAHPAVGPTLAVARGVLLAGLAWTAASAYARMANLAVEAELELGRRERRGRALLDALTDPTAVLDPQGRIVAVNQAWIRFAAEDQAGQALGEVGHGYPAACEAAAAAGFDGLEAAADGVRSVLAGELSLFRCRYRVPGDAGPCEVTVTPWPTATAPWSPTARRRTHMALARCDSVSGVALSDRLADQPAADGVPSRPSGRWRTLLRFAVAGMFIAVIAVVMAGQWQQAKPLLGRLSVASILAALALILAGLYATFRCWWAVLADLGGHLPSRPAKRVFYHGQLGKYLPGTVWPAVTQMRLGRDYQVPPRASGAAFVVFMLLIVGTGLLVGVPVIPLLGRDAADQYHWLLLVLPLLAVAVAPPVLNRTLALALRLARRPPLPAPLSLAGILKATGWAIGSWLCYGLHVYLLARQLGAEGGALLWLQCTGAFAIAFASGPLLVIAPAGAGVREAALLLLLGSTITAPRAAVIAVVSRLLFIVGDLAWAAVALVAARRLVRPPGPSP
jgi:glycosyltransferase 2 family protein